MPGLIKRDRGAENVGLGTGAAGPRPGPDEVVIEVYATGICGTDLHIQDDEFPSIPPVVMGHEVTGRVVEAGAGRRGLAGQARLALRPTSTPAIAARACLAGRRNLCPTRRSIGSPRQRRLRHATSLVPQRNLHEVHDSVGEHAGALYEPLSLRGPVPVRPGRGLPR